MNIAEYQQAGYAVSNHVRQEVIDRLEGDVAEAYITPLVGTATGEAIDAAVKSATMELVFFALLKEEAVATRTGGKVKTLQNSYTPDAWVVLGERARYCDLRLDTLRRLTGSDAAVTDILGLYFKTNFVSY